MARTTSSSNRSKRKTQKPVTKGQNPQRANRQAASQAKVTSAEARKPSPRSAGINQGKGMGAGRVTGTLGRPKPATPAKVTTGSTMSRMANTVAKSARAAKTAMAGSRAASALRAAPMLANPLTAAAAGTTALAAYGVSKGEVKRTKGAMQGKQTNLRGGGSVAGQQRASRATAAAAGSTSAFKGARSAAMKKAAAIKGSPVVGPKKSGTSSFDSAFASARKAGKSTFTWRGKKYNTKMKGE